MKKKTRIYLLTEEELERFDQLLTALGQAYWAIARSRSITVPRIETASEITKEEESFYQLHFEVNDFIDTTQDK